MLTKPEWFQKGARVAVQGRAGFWMIVETFHYSVCGAKKECNCTRGIYWAELCPEGRGPHLTAHLENMMWAPF